MNNRVKFFAFLLAACLVFTMFAGVAYATEGDPDQNIIPTGDLEGGDLDPNPNDPDNGDGGDGGNGDGGNGDGGDDGNGDGGDLDDPDPLPQITYCMIRFDANGGSGTAYENSAEVGKAYELPNSTPYTAPEGKQFKGWSASAAGSIITSVTPTGDMTVYAIWEAIPADPDNGDGGNGDGGNGDGGNGDNGDGGNGGETTHTCQWTYEAKGASIIATCTADSVSAASTDAADSSACPYDGEVKVSLGSAAGAVALIGADKFNEATGNSIDASDIKYSDDKGQEYTSAPTEKGSYIATLTVEGATAKLQYRITATGGSSTTVPSRYTITYVANGGCGCPCYYDRVKVGSTTRVMCNPFSAKGLIFIGWSTRASGCDGAWFEPGECIKPTRDMTLYARWIAEDCVSSSSTGHNNQHYKWSYTCGPNGIILVSPKTGDASVIAYAAMAVAAAAGIVIKRRSK